MPSRARKTQNTDTPSTNEENTVTQTSTEPTTADSPTEITVNVAVAIKINPAKWSTEEFSPTDLLVAKIKAEKGVDDAKAQELAQFMLDNGLAGLVTASKGAGVNDVRREIREYVLAQVAGLEPFTQAGATVELNEARRTNHKPKDKADAAV